MVPSQLCTHLSVPVASLSLVFSVPSSRAALACRPSLTLPLRPSGLKQPRPPGDSPASGGRRGGGSDPAPCSAREPSAKRSLRTSGGLCAGPGRPPCAPLRCLLPPFCWGDPHPLPPDGEGDRLPLDRWLPVFRPSSRRLGLSLAGGREEGEPAWDGPSASDRDSPCPPPLRCLDFLFGTWGAWGALPPGGHQHAPSQLLLTG